MNHLPPWASDNLAIAPFRFFFVKNSQLKVFTTGVNDTGNILEKQLNRRFYVVFCFSTTYIIPRLLVFAKGSFKLTNSANIALMAFSLFFLSLSSSRLGRFCLYQLAGGSWGGGGGVAELEPIQQQQNSFAFFLNFYLLYDLTFLETVLYSSSVHCAYLCICLSGVQWSVCVWY